LLSHQEEIDFLSFVSDRHDKPFYQVLDSLPSSWNEFPVTQQQLLFAANAKIINGDH